MLIKNTLCAQNLVHIGILWRPWISDVLNLCIQLRHSNNASSSGLEKKKIPGSNVECDEGNTACLRNIDFQRYSDTADRPTGSSSPKLQIKFTNSQIPSLK